VHLTISIKHCSTCARTTATPTVAFTAINAKRSYVYSDL
jgi:hypothetical protein